MTTTTKATTTTSDVAQPRSSLGGLVSRAAQAGLCGNCRAPIMRGLDGDVAAFLVTVDPNPLDPLGEALALLAGRATFELRWQHGRYELEHRDAWSITARPAGTHPRLDVVAAHTCRTPRLPSPPHGSRTRQPRRETLSDAAPF